MNWKEFVTRYGWRTRADLVAAAIGRTEQEVRQQRERCSPGRPPDGKAKSFSELFSLWHGRAPEDAEWPAPRRRKRGDYEWLEPERVLLASLVGRLGPREIAAALTDRLRSITGDRRAVRTRYSVLIAMNGMGLTTADVVGGITVSAAALEIGSRAVLNHAIRIKALKTTRVGRLLVISHEDWAGWKAMRSAPPAGYVTLASIKNSLSIKCDKLPEFASLGYIPGAVRVNTFGTPHNNNRFGTWYIPKQLARKLVADRHAGRPMPWHGRPLPSNMKATWTKYDARRHPASCETCREIWGKDGAPRTFEAFNLQYPSLDFGAKLHLTRKWTTGLTLRQVAALSGRSLAHVQAAVRNGQLSSQLHGGRRYVTKADATRWKARHCPSGDGKGCWISMEEASKQYDYSIEELKSAVRAGNIESRRKDAGSLQLMRHQIGKMREEQGYTLAQAARRAGVSVARMRVLLRGLEWRERENIPLVTVHAAIRRQKSAQGYTLQEAARLVGKPVEWVRAEVRAGTVRLLKVKWDRKRLYLSAPMISRLETVARNPPKRVRNSSEWILLGEATVVAGVSAATLAHWASTGSIRRRESQVGWRYHRRSLMAQARAYWPRSRFKRAQPPDWLLKEQPGLRA